MLDRLLPDSHNYFEIMSGTSVVTYFNALHIYICMNLTWHQHSENFHFFNIEI